MLGVQLDRFMGNVSLQGKASCMHSFIRLLGCRGWLDFFPMRVNYKPTIVHCQRKQ